jgi:hypothetical protein
MCRVVRGWSPNVEGNRRAGRMYTNDQVAHRRVRLTVRLGLDPSHFAGQQGREAMQEKRDERP